jgi:hypothetical protein
VGLRVPASDGKRNVWDHALASMPGRSRDVYFESEYGRVWHRHGDGGAMGAIWEKHGARVPLAFLPRDRASLPTLGDAAGPTL